MTCPKSARYIREEPAHAYCNRLSKAYPNRFFGVMRHPYHKFWAVAMYKEGGLFNVKKFMLVPHGPLPGEKGYKPPQMYQYKVEYTDTFCGEANYCWVNRATVKLSEHADQSRIMRAAKAAVGLTGMRGCTYWHGDEGEFRPSGMCTILFVRFDDR
jgi:hypothetical protein